MGRSILRTRGNRVRGREIRKEAFGKGSLFHNIVISHVRGGGSYRLHGFLYWSECLLQICKNNMNVNGDDRLSGYANQ